MASRVRPLLILVPLPPTYRGGTEEYAYELARCFSEQFPVEVVSSTVDPTPESPPVPTGSAVLERVPARHVLERPLVIGGASLARIRERVRSAGLVQLHMPFPFVERRVVQWAHEARVPVVLTYHMDADLAGARRLPGAGAITAAYRAWSAHPALREADAVVANSSGYARNSPVLRHHLDRVRVIPKGIDLARFGVPWPVPPGRLDPADGLLPGARPSDHRVVFVGRLVPYKGLPVLFEAIAQLARSDPELRLFVAGKGPERPALERRAAALGIGDRVRFLGFVPDARLAELYRSADVVACPSIGQLESSATALEEAATLGTPTLGSDLPGADETIPHDGTRGLLCPPGDAEALARALERLLGQPRPAPPSTAPRTWERVAEEYRALFAELGYPDGPRPGSATSPIT